MQAWLLSRAMAMSFPCHVLALSLPCPAFVNFLFHFLAFGGIVRRDEL